MNNQRVAVFTSSMGGGIMQFSHCLAKSIKETGRDVCLYYPDMNDIIESCPCVAYSYVEVKDLLPGRKNDCTRLAQDVISRGADVVIFCDQGVSSRKVARLLKGRVRTVATIHDASPHPSNTVDLKSRLRDLAGKLLAGKRLGFADEYLLLSQSTTATFKMLHPEYAGSVHTMALCAHPAADLPVMPPELNGIGGNYLLFFGRIDKYKGIARMLRAYMEANVDVPLVVAGGGELTFEEEELAAQPGVVLVNRFIEDGEMAWLFSHAFATVLPYIEASQSGVLVMSYHYGKPVLVSNLPGLSEFVMEGRTGYVCATEGELSLRMQSVLASDVDWKSEIAAYERENLDLTRNVAGFLDSLSNR